MLSSGHKSRTLSDSWKLDPVISQPTSPGVGCLWTDSSDGTLHYTDTLGLDNQITGAGSNPFDQSLNTTDDVKFIGVEVAGPPATYVLTVTTGDSYFNNDVIVDNGLSVTNTLNVNGDYQHNSNPGLIVSSERPIGVNNLICGQNSGLSLVGGSDNVIIGRSSAQGLTSGSNNVMIGPNVGNTDTTSRWSSKIGSHTSGNFDFSIALGAGAECKTANECVLGGPQASLSQSGLDERLVRVRPSEGGVTNLGSLTEPWGHTYTTNTTMMDGGHLQLGVTGSALLRPCVSTPFIVGVSTLNPFELVKIGPGGAITKVLASDLSSIPIVGCSMTGADPGLPALICIGGSWECKIENGVTINPGDLVEKSSIEDGRITVGFGVGPFGVCEIGGVGNVSGTVTARGIYHKNELF